MSIGLPFKDYDLTFRFCISGVTAADGPAGNPVAFDGFFGWAVADDVDPAILFVQRMKAESINEEFRGEYGLHGTGIGTAGESHNPAGISSLGLVVNDEYPLAAGFCAEVDGRFDIEIRPDACGAKRCGGFSGTIELFSGPWNTVLVAGDGVRAESRQTKSQAAEQGGAEAMHEKGSGS